MVLLHEQSRSEAKAQSTKARKMFFMKTLSRIFQGLFQIKKNKL
jgi:hypothetical protein